MASDMLRTGEGFWTCKSEPELNKQIKKQAELKVRSSYLWHRLEPGNKVIVEVKDCRNDFLYNACRNLFIRYRNEPEALQRWGSL